MALSSWTQYCSHLKVKDLLGNQFPVFWYVREDEKIPQVLEFLAKHNISSVPVIDKEDSKFIGLVDWVDLATLVSSVVEAQKQVGDLLPIEELKETISGLPVLDCCDLSEQNPSIPVSQEDSFDKILVYFSKKTNLHRVFVVKEPFIPQNFVLSKEQVIGILTQSRVITFLYNSIDKVPPEILNITVKEWYHTNNSQFRMGLEAVKPLDPVYKAFAHILAKEITGAVVLDDHGKLLGSLSTSDLKRSAGSDLLSDMQLTVEQYLKKSHVGREPVTCVGTDTVSTLLEKLVKNCVHRLVVLDTEGKPYAVISLCDIICLFKR